MGKTEDYQKCVLQFCSYKHIYISSSHSSYSIENQGALGDADIGLQCMGTFDYFYAFLGVSLNQGTSVAGLGFDLGFSVYVLKDVMCLAVNASAADCLETLVPAITRYTCRVGR